MLLSFRWGIAPAERLEARSHMQRIAAMFRCCSGLVGLLVIGLCGPGCRQPSPGVGSTRTYYIAAEEVEWDYAPSGRDLVTGADFGDKAKVFVERGPDRIGRVYTKALYREYVDGTFTLRKSVPPEWGHLGSLGPLIRAAVGDTIVVHFKNNTRIPASVHPHGVLYDKRSEGTPYADGTGGRDKADDVVPPGGRYTYTWQVPERAGPGPHDGSSTMWMYHSHVDEPRDTNSGLVGPMIITGAGSVGPGLRPRDVDREFVLLLTIADENESWFVEHNLGTKAPSVTRPPEELMEDPDFQESNLMHSVNGYIYGNLPPPTIRLGERVRWYVMAMGTEVDVHTAHWHGQSLLMSGMRTDVAEVFPGSMKVLDMVASNPGTWLFHCHVNDHIAAGMIALFRVEPQ